jgi:hypothetical protein
MTGLGALSVRSAAAATTNLANVLMKRDFIEGRAIRSFAVTLVSRE